MGMLDSHEAMNNRETPTKMREKRSYEFLMGLINNNSRYEVTKVDPSISKKKLEIVDKDQTTEEDTTSEEEEQDNNVAASELLLELMVKIAAHPDQWDDVHELLQKIDEDLTISEDILEKINRKRRNKKAKHLMDKLKIEKKTEETKSSTEKPHTTTKLSTTTRQITTEKLPAIVRKVDKTSEENSHQFNEEKLPYFDRLYKNVQYVNSNAINSESTTESSQDILDKQSRATAYPKNFAYHRVTGTPFNLNKNPKAYIAVSVIAPKPANVESKDDDVALENELHQLKPWNRMKTNENSELIGSSWVIQNNREHPRESVL